MNWALINLVTALRVQTAPAPSMADDGVAPSSGCRWEPQAFAACAVPAHVEAYSNLTTRVRLTFVSGCSPSRTDVHHLLP